MSLLTVCQALAKNVGLAVPTSIVGNQDRQWVEALQFANETGDEMARRVDWHLLAAEWNLIGLGTLNAFDLPDAFARLHRGGGVMWSGVPLRAISRDEFSIMRSLAGSAPRFFVIEGRRIRFAPPLPVGELVNVRYQSDLWVAGGAYTDDDAVAVVPEDILTKGLIVRWRRQKGMPYADEEAEYEAALAQAAEFQSGARFK